ncbi:MAG TPA: LytR C-terminal domain-containing protein [Candidatus Eisenbacteria bacterium]|nr:LytR C-terminal domain-containing protein [Candidatus Eisenbacteria bacterium]
MARRGSAWARLGIVALGVVVAALALSLAWARFRPRPVVTVSPAPGVRRVIRVQVLNGTGEAGVAGKVASALREGGFHVVEVRNADRQDYYATLVVARRDDPVAALAVAKYLGGPPVIRQAWSSDEAEVTVVLGSDRSRLRLEP